MCTYARTQVALTTHITIQYDIYTRIDQTCIPGHVTLHIYTCTYAHMYTYVYTYQQQKRAYRVTPAFRPHRPLHHHGQIGQAGVQERVILVVVLEGGKDVVQEAAGERCVFA